MKVNIMELSEIITELNLVNVNKKPIKGDLEINHGYACDLLSQVLADAKAQSIWLTVQSHMNTIGVAVMTGISAIVICEGHDVTDSVIEKADNEQIALFKSNKNAFELAGLLYERGIR
jgi:hypothetical protein